MRDTATGLAIGLAGGLVFWLLGIPAPWLAGSMMAAIVAVFSKVRMGVPDWLRALAFIFLGIQTGTAVSWDTVDRAIHWPLSIAFLCLTVVAITWACTAYYIRRSDWDPATALFASLPGALSLTLLLASGTKADMRRVTIAQCIRLFFLVAALPTVITWLRPSEEVMVTLSQIGGVWDILLLVAVSSAAGLALEWLKVPAGLIMGPMLASAGLELSGLIDGAAPASILIPANVVLGVMIGVRFAHFTFTEFRQALVEGFSGFVIALIIAMAGAGVAAWFSNLPFALTLLAFSPGGLDAMTIMAFSLNLDPAYVGAHQMARYIALALLMPTATSYVLRRMGAYGGASAAMGEKDRGW
jgi:hypothetical protein